MQTEAKKETQEMPLDPGGRSASICSPLPDQRVVEALDWLHTAMCEMESAIRLLSPNPNSGELLCCRAALRRAQGKIREITDMSAVCQANAKLSDEPTNNQ